jgi:hypothetical protein
MGFFGIFIAALVGFYSSFNKAKRFLFLYFNILLLLKNRVFFLRPFSHTVWVGLILILSDTFANLVVFINGRSDYLSSCVTNASGRFENELSQAFKGMNNVSLDRSSDFYNCSRLWTDELKLSILVFILMLVLYVSVKLMWYDNVRRHLLSSLQC